MNLITRITQVIMAMIGLLGIMLYIYKLYQPNDTKKINPYLYEHKYYDVPTKEELEKLIDELTDYDQTYNHNFYIKKAKFSPSSLTRGWAQGDKTSEITKQMNQRQFILLRTDKGDIYCKGEIMVKFGMDLNIRTQQDWFFISASWAADNECRKYWWGGKNPRALN